MNINLAKHFILTINFIENEIILILLYSYKFIKYFFKKKKK
jgi:hypothetical protein